MSWMDEVIYKERISELETVIKELEKDNEVLNKDRQALIRIVEQCEKAGINYNNSEFGGYLYRAVMDAVANKVV